MMKSFISVIIFFFSIVGFSQDSLVYLPLEAYKKLGFPTSEIDSLNFQFHNGDTLVLMPKGWKRSRAANEVEVEYEPQNPIFLEKYKKVVFRNEKATLKIWKDEIKIYFDESVPIKHKKTLLDFAYGVSASVDSLKIREVESKEASNYFVFYKGKKNSPENPPKISSRQSDYYLNWNGKQQITSATLMVDSNMILNETLQLANLKFQFFRTLGFFGGSDSFNCHSYFSNCSNIRNLTDLDMRILKYHYSYGVCKGVNKKSFEDFHIQMTETLRKDPTAKIVVIHKI